MIKKILLASSVLSLAFASNAAEKEFYVIQDGKMVNCEFVPSAEPVEESYEIEESTNAAGDAMVKVKNPKNDYKAGFLYLPKAIDLNEAWNLEIEYFFEKDMELSPTCADHEGWAIDLMADTMAVGDSVWKTSPKQVDYRLAHVSVDARMRDFYTYKDGELVLDNHGTGMLRKVTKYVYSSPLLPKGICERGDANKVKAIFISMFNEASKELVGYIKNLKFVSDGTKPFYADRMTILDGEGTIYMSSFPNYVYATNGGDFADAEIGKMSKENGIASPNQMYGQQLFVSQVTNGYKNIISGDRMYCKFAEQAEADFFDTEYGFLPYMGIADGSRTGHQDGDLLADAQIRIPLGAAVKENIDVVMRLGHNAGTTGKEVPYEDYKAKSGDIRFPVMYRFESGDAKKISSKTEWKQFTPTYTKDSTDTVDSIPTMMNMVYGKVQRPSEDYTYLTLRFIPNDVISYMFGDIRLTGDTGWWPTRKSDFVFGEDYMGNQIPVALRADVENIVAKGEISIYPNPATDVITVTNEGVNSVAVYSVAGSLVASSESNVVNVANLVNGIYVVKANTEAGVITGQIIKK